MKQLLSTLLVTVFLFSLPELLCSQRQADNWYFGSHAGLTFSNGSPATLLNGALSTGEGCASISDSAGNLLFYTDGVTVYNTNHIAMQNGTGLMGAASSSQSAIILKKPGSAVLYYVFTIDYNYLGGSNSGNGFRYSIINMSLNNGLGDVDVTNKNILIRGRAMERLTAAKHRNDSDFWILITDFTEDEIFAYHLSCSGLNLVPVKSNVGPFFSNSSGATFGYMRVSRQNNRIAMAGWCNRSFLLFDFDNQTGLASNRTTIVNSQGKIDNCTYGVEFSPNGNLLYGTTIDGPRSFFGDFLINDNLRIFQFNLAYNNGNTIGDSLKIIATHPSTYSGGYSFYYGALQLGPDGKIYSASCKDTVIGVIKFPNLLGSACSYSNNISLGGRKSELGLPNILVNYVQPYYDTTTVSICSNGSYTLCNGTTITSSGIYACHFSTATSCDSTSIVKIILLPNDTAAQAISVCAPYIWYGQSITQPGTYFHNLINRWGCDSIIRLNVTINPSYKDTITKTICQGDTFWGQSTTGYYTRHFQTILGCDSSVTAHLLVKPVVITNETATICRGNNLYDHNETGVYTDTISPCTYRRLTLTVMQPHTDRLVRTICRGEDLFGHKNPGKYLDTIGLCRYRFLNLSVDDKPTRYIPADTILCEGSTLYLDAGQYSYIKWQDGSSGSSYKVAKPGRYLVTVGNQCDTVTFSCTVSIKQCSLKIPNAFSPNKDGINDTWMIATLEQYSNCRVTVYNRWGQAVFNSIGYGKPWNGEYNGNPLPVGTYYYVITIDKNSYTGWVVLLR